MHDLAMYYIILIIVLHVYFPEFFGTDEQKPQEPQK